MYVQHLARTAKKHTMQSQLPRVNHSWFRVVAEALKKQQEQLLPPQQQGPSLKVWS
jgi:hypothetical protein